MSNIDIDKLKQLSPDDLTLLAELEEHWRFNKIEFFKPYARQKEFFAQGAEKRERLFMAGNRVGKTESGAYEMACHLTGLYPDWWVGKQFEKPIRAWAVSETVEFSRDVAQLKLCGVANSDEGFGTGMIPKHLLIGKTAAPGGGGGFGSIRVQHVAGESSLGFKNYAQGRQRLQGETLQVVWCDEEPPAPEYSECMNRLTGDGICYTTCTPLLGYTEFINRFVRCTDPEELRTRGHTRMGLAHAEHFSEQEKADRIAAMPAHERKARENGDPYLGSGAVFEEVQEANITVSMLLSDVPRHWALLWGIDFGIAHPFAAVLIAWDRDTDTIYVVDGFKMSGGIPLNHADRMKGIAPNVPVAWPHDGAAREAGSGEPLAALYKQQSLRMLPSHATHVSGGYSTEAGVADMLGRMRSGKFKVASHLFDWFEEFRGYHRKDGLIVKLNDDLMSATRIAVMAHRKAQSLADGKILGDPRRTRPTGRGRINPWTGRPEPLTR
jgi:phage terminase large subunit-like protein